MNFLLAVLGEMTKTVAVVALCIGTLGANMTFLVTNKTSVIFLSEIMFTVGDNKVAVAC